MGGVKWADGLVRGVCGLWRAMRRPNESRARAACTAQPIDRQELGHGRRVYYRSTGGLRRQHRQGDTKSPMTCRRVCHPWFTPARTALTFSEQLGVCKRKSGSSSRGHVMGPRGLLEPPLWPVILQWSQHPKNNDGISLVEDRDCDQ